MYLKLRKIVFVRNFTRILDIMLRQQIALKMELFRVKSRQTCKFHCGRNFQLLPKNYHVFLPSKPVKPRRL